MLLGAKRESLPQGTGVYLFYDAEDSLLYIGKAKNIRNRVRGHFASPQKPWIKQVEKIDFLLLPSEEEALLTERQLILSRRPRYNIRLRDDKSYPMIAISLDEEYPRVYITREKRQPGRRYFGPWTDGKRARQLLMVLPQIFPFRSCKGKEPGRASGNPCLDYHIGRCGAPCVGYISKEEYRQGIDEIIAFLSGKRKEVEEGEQKRMEKAAKARDYEKAALHRDRLRALQKLSPRKGGWGPDRDVFGVWVNGEEASVCVLEVRQGIIAERRSFLLENKGGLSEEEVLEQFQWQYEGSAERLEGESSGKPGQLLRIAKSDAKLHLLKDRAERATGSLQLSEAMRQLQDATEGERAPLRIEGYDVANLGSESTVGSMVVFEGGVRKRSHYRTFNIKSEDKPDDYRSLANMIRRRVAAWEKMSEMSPYDKERDESFSALPDLILIDGGKGQLSVALRELQPFLAKGVVVLALAKKKEHVFSADKGELLDLPPTSPGSMLLQRVRDEAHRTSNARHQSLRKKKLHSSPLQGIPGIGPKKRQALLEHFGSLNRIKAAREEDLLAVPGINKDLAKAISRKMQL